MADDDRKQVSLTRSGVVAGAGVGSAVAGALALFQFASALPSAEEFSSVRTQAETALRVVEQHGGEFVTLRQDYSALRADLLARIKLAADDRFRGSQWQAEDKRIRELWSAHERRLEERLAELDRRIGHLEDAELRQRGHRHGE